MGLETPLHVIAQALGIKRTRTKTDCVQCGSSPFENWGHVKKLGKMFNRHEFFPNPSASYLCHGCKKILGGHSRDKPLRLYSFRIDDVFRDVPEIIQILPADWWGILQSPPSDPIILSWAQSKKKHHALFAGYSMDGVWRIGADEESLIWEHDLSILESAQSLYRAGCTKAQIVVGHYPAPLLSKIHPIIEQHERVLSPFRKKNPAPLDLIVYAIPKSTKTKHNEPMALSSTDSKAAHLLCEIAFHSSARVENGIQFWGGYFLARIKRFMRLPLPDMVSRLIGTFGTGVTHDIVQILDAMDDQEMASISQSIRERPDLIHAAAYSQLKSRKSKTK